MNLVRGGSPYDVSVGGGGSGECPRAIADNKSCQGGRSSPSAGNRERGRQSEGACGEGTDIGCPCGYGSGEGWVRCRSSTESGESGGGGGLSGAAAGDWERKGQTE